MASNPVFKADNLAVITGGASGIGLALATKLASYGMKILIADISESNLTSAKGAIKGNVDTFEMDVSKVESYERLKTKIESEYEGMR
jgi:NADP-dependent 3-hydroxy acid dehydrogenase YdfG